MPSGGRRQGRPGRKYPNRSDMRTQKPQAVPNQQYGQAGAQLASQQQMPLGNAMSSAAPVAGSSPAPPQAAPGGGGPQVIPSLTAPTTRPNEPITAGLSSGPGGGPEMLQGPDPLVKAAALLNSIGGKDPGLSLLRARLNAHLGNQGAA